MTAAKLIGFTLQLSLALGVFCVAMEATVQARRWIRERAGLLVRTLVAMFVIMPLFALALVSVFHLRHGLEIALVTLALSPVPPVLPKKQLKAGGGSAYVVALMLVTSLFAIVFVPVAVSLIGRAVGRSFAVATGPLARTIGLSLVVPLLAGALVRRLAPAFAERYAKPLAKAASILLLLSFLPMLVAVAPAMAALTGNFTLIAIAVFVVAGLLAGHFLGGPEEEDRTVLALATATRHPAVAIAIAQAVVPGDKTVPAAVLLYAVAGGFFAGPYVRWRTKRAAAPVPPPAA